MRFLTALIAGLLFGAGLLLSGMTNPQVVLGFLDIAGAWNPALAFTMAGAILVAAPAFWLARKRGRTLDGETIELPGRALIDARLVGGAALFGVGWGMAGICPGPGLILLTGLSAQAFVFVAAMLAGMLLAHRLLRRSG
jgi:uncharacterized membrane protein YedE/YeeE